MESGRCIIVAAGEFHKEVFLTHVAVGEADFVISCDAGLINCDAVGIEPQLVVGDFDSGARQGAAFLDRIRKMEEKTPERVLRLPVEKDDTDLMRAIKEGLTRGYRNFLIFGALGGERFSLSYAAVQSLLYLKHYDAQGSIISKNAILRIIENETATFLGKMSGHISLFALSERVEGVTLTGLQYALQDAVLTNDFPLGVSNAFIEGETATVSVRKGTLLAVLEPHLPETVMPSNAR